MRSVFNLLFGFSLLLRVLFHGEANISGDYKSENDGVYIVYMGKTSLDDGFPRSDHVELLSQLKTRNKNSIVQTYNKSFLGFAARLSDEEAKSIARRPEVVSVFPDHAAKLHTTHSWDFLKSQNSAFEIKDSIKSLSISRFVSNWSTGADTIIGIIDTGIWPEHPSFNDKYMGPIPSHWKGICMPSKNSTPFKCNRKVIGARYYDNPHEGPGSMSTARDKMGHGSHVASIAAGNPVWGASYYGLAKGLARGGSPGSRIAAYRVCGSQRCAVSGILKAFEDAIADGVDVLSVSLGGEFQDLLTDPIAIGAFHAVEKGITVVCSVGNEGPSPGTVGNFVPWVVSVAATTMDRDFESVIELGDRNRMIKGGGINFSGHRKPSVYPLVYGGSASSKQTSAFNASNCIPGSLDNDKVKGKIVLCEDEGDFLLLLKKINTLETQGAMGMIVISNDLRQDPYYYGTTPLAAVTEGDGAQIRAYIDSTRKPLATILPTEVILNYKPAPVVPYYSSRGPSAHGYQNIIKPDVAAPGVAVLGAWRLNDTYVAIPGEEPPLFNIDSGTSMACPHVSGLAATVKSQHPTWTPSAIRSAIMTTAIQTNNSHDPITTDRGSRATPYDIGAGEITLFGPLCPGLIYETKNTDYVQFLCNMGYNASVIKSISSTVPSNFDCASNSSPDLISDMNYPSIAISGFKANGRRRVKRRVTNVGEAYSTYTATVEAPASVQVQVVPNILRFTKNTKTLSFQIIFKLATAREDLFGSVTWSNGRYKVRSPFVVRHA